MTRREAAQRKPSLHLAPAPREELGAFDGVEFQRERLAPIVRELLPLIEADWRENGVEQERIPLNLNLNQYLDYDLVGILQIVTAREDDVMVGFVFNFVHPHIMHVGMGWALINLYWLYPEYRKRGIGRALMEANIKFLEAAKVQVIEASEKIGHSHGLFQRLGFTPTDTVLRKIIGG